MLNMEVSKNQQQQHHLGPLEEFRAEEILPRNMWKGVTQEYTS